jgi:hypothetical protein
MKRALYSADVSEHLMSYNNGLMKKSAEKEISQANRGRGAAPESDRRGEYIFFVSEDSSENGPGGHELSDGRPENRVASEDETLQENEAVDFFLP